MATNTSVSAGSDVTQRKDYIAHGSPEYAMFLGLVKATKEDDPELVVDGYTLADFTIYPPEARPDWLRRIVAQKVRTLKAPVAVPEDAPPLWQPVVGEGGNTPTVDGLQRQLAELQAGFNRLLAKLNAQ